MADRRKPQLLRFLISFLPAQLRFALIRNQLKISNHLDSRFTFRIARTREELSESYRILLKNYVEQGYAKPVDSEMRIIKHFALPTTTTLIALFDNKVVGTVSIIRRAQFDLPIESAFSLAEYIEKNDVVAEVSSLAIDPEFRLKRGSLFLPLLKFFWEYVENYMNLDVIVIAVNPTMSDFYEALLAFSRLKCPPVSDYNFANGNPAIGLFLDVRKAPKIFKELYGDKVQSKNLYDYFVNLKLNHFEMPHRTFYKSAGPVMDPEMLHYFFSEKSTVFKDLTDQERMGLASAYPQEYYRSILPLLNTESLRNEVRHQLNRKAIVMSSSESEIIILDVARKGLCAFSSIPLSGILMLRIEVAEGCQAEVRGVVRWANEDRQLYGIELIKTDINWNKFVSYLDEDFISLFADRSKKKVA
jgi:hypothetical protein